ncbi:NADH-quinone oxidoreductase subunit J family protein [Acidianus ambivalens]|uniref:NADH-quinone oxidoreductase subunit J n=1 Tax=Acidianus ambivalens TaxID=2283 RepID=A0A650CSD0_ACIAM|nr:NADH-quinone oxidoreductase subunit J [Acidianus ambivalens]MQL55184.1 NADH-quinone oxidoreductase subunit J [Acidianus ambivalens]QGR20730.1 NADH-quinone oxidoreductase subunit J [Acidianus ambivalens]
MFQSLNLCLILFLFFSIISISSAIFIVSSKNLFYAAISLAFLGVSIAVLIALISFQYSLYSVFHLLLYVGATVVFLSISLVMFKGLEVRQINIAWAPIVAGVSAVLIFIAVVLSLSGVQVSQVGEINLQTLSSIILEKYWFPAVVLVVGLLTTLIEAITLARRD